MQDLPNFFGLLLWNFWTVLAGIMLGVEPVTRWFWPEYDAWAANFLPAVRRRRIARFAALLAFVGANYLAFHDMAEQLRQRSLSSNEFQQKYTQLIRNRYDPLTGSEQASFRSLIRDIPAQPLAILCNHAGCNDLAESFSEAFHDLAWQVRVEPGIDFGNSPKGISIWSDNVAARPLAEAIEKATGGRLKVSLFRRNPEGSANLNHELDLVLGRNLSCRQISSRAMPSGIVAQTPPGTRKRTPHSSKVRFFVRLASA
jgi:hypothetical protein